jgi:hypothetical protein
MVTRVDRDGRAYEVTLQEYGREVERNDYATRLPSKPGQPSRLWDCIDQSWSKPFPADQIFNHHLRKIVSKCSACKYTSPYQASVAMHLETIKQQIEQHQTASLVPHSEDGYMMCTGCGMPFQIRKMQAQRHLEGLNEAEAAHMNVEVLDILRYAVQPSEPVILGRKTLVTGSQASEMAVAQPPGIRRRRRRRNRSRRDNSRR